MLRQLYGSSAKSLELAGLIGVGAGIAFALLPILLIILIVSSGIEDFSASKALSVVFDERNLMALTNSLAVGIATAVLVVTLSTTVALVLNRINMTGDPLIYSLAFISLLIPDYVVGVASYALLEPQFGLLASILPDWLLADRTSALLCVTAVVIVKWLPMLSVIIDARIASIPCEKLRQAKLDFETYSQQVKYVIGPEIIRLIPLLLTFIFLIGFRQQELAAQLTSQGGGYSAEMWASWNYRVIYQFSDLFAASAEALLIIAILVIALEVFRRTAVKAIASEE